MDTEKKPVVDKALRCGIVPVRFAWGDWQLLLLRSGNLWDFPAGVVSIHEDSLEAAKRETLAATALTDLEFNFGEDSKETVPYAGNNVDRYYVAETRTEKIDLPVSKKTGRPVREEWRWATCDEAEEFLPPRLTHVLEWVRQQINE